MKAEEEDIMNNVTLEDISPTYTLKGELSG